MLKPLLTFSVPTVLNDSDEARSKAEREFKKIVREAARYFGREKVEQIVREITKRRRGNTPNEQRNALMLEEYDAAPRPVTKKEFAREFYEKHHQQSAEAVEKRLTRLLKARQQKKAERKFPPVKSWRGKSLLGTE
jgi:hypothetical protein